MSDIYGFIVGIDKYDQPDWNVAGPCVNAIAMADWLLSIGVEGDQITLFLDAHRDLKPETEHLRAKNVRVNESAASDKIDTFWRKDLAAGCPANSKLLGFWSGHGFTNAQGSRIFFCRDYTEQALNNRVFDGSNFLRKLHSAGYACFSEQIFLADVCGVYSKLTAPTANEPAVPIKTQQTAYFATPEGEYAKGNNGRGVFTEMALSVLRGAGKWPDPEAFVQSMEEAFKGVGQTPFRVGGFYRNAGIPDHIVGSAPLRSELFNSVFAVLSKPNLPDAVFRPHYLRTVTDLGQPELAKAQGLTGMVAELAALKDAGGPNKVPYGLAQFLMRLGLQGELRQPIEDWFVENPIPGNTRANIQATLDAENLTKILVIEAQNDEQGRFSEFQAYLRNRDLSPVPGVAFPSESVKDWDDFQQKFLILFKSVQSTLASNDFQIHFVVDPPLFDYPFHLIPIKLATALGERHVVLLRYRERLRFGNADVRAAWRQYADALRPTKPAQLKLVPLPSPGPDGPVPGERGLCYLNFILRTSVGAGPNVSSEKRTLLQLLWLGVPYLCWLHGSSAPEGYWLELEKQLTLWLGGLKTLDQFPGQLLYRRGGGNPYASQATLLWDDPQFDPFQTTRGVSVK